MDAANSVDPQLLVDIKEIQDQLQNIKIEGADERSDALSEVRSNLLKTLTTLGGSRMSRLQSRQAGTSPRRYHDRRYTENAKPREQAVPITSQTAEGVPEDADIGGLTRAATAGEAEAKQAVEIIQERADEEEPEPGLLANQARTAEPASASQ